MFAVVVGIGVWVDVGCAFGVVLVLCVRLLLLCSGSVWVVCYCLGCCLLLGASGVVAGGWLIGVVACRCCVLCCWCCFCCCVVFGVGLFAGLLLVGGWVVVCLWLVLRLVLLFGVPCLCLWLACLVNWSCVGVGAVFGQLVAWW